MTLTFPRHIAVLVGCAAVVAFSSFDGMTRSGAKDETAREHAEKLFQSSCISCHLPPDPDHATDRAWLSQVKDTAWSETPTKARAALIDYLGTRPFPLPEVVAAQPEASQGDRGTVTASFERGDLFLSDAEGKAYRLTWSGDESDETRARALPTGVYTLRTYRIVREQDGELWHVSGTAPSIQKIAVKAGESVVVEIDDAIHMHADAHGDRALMIIKGHDGAGLSIYREGQRIPIGYRFLAPNGVELTSGSMRYGWGGGGWAPLESSANGRLELVYDEPPFEIDAKM